MTTYMESSIVNLLMTLQKPLTDVDILNFALNLVWQLCQHFLRLYSRSAPGCAEHAQAEFNPTRINLACSCSCCRSALRGSTTPSPPQGRAFRPQPLAVSC